MCIQGRYLNKGGISALVVMNNPVDAKKAFQALAYSRFRTQPLYLEWAPGDVLGQNSTENKVAETEEAPAESNEGRPEKEKKKKNKREMTYEEKKAEKRKRRGQDQDIAEENVGEIQSTSKDDGDSQEAAKAVEEECNPPQEVSQDQEQGTEEDVIEPGSTVFVKNLSFETSEKSLDKLFR
ncbi:hypothetical protein COOONC_25704 [Cooperia oncophora]